MKKRSRVHTKRTSPVVKLCCVFAVLVCVYFLCVLYDTASKPAHSKPKKFTFGYEVVAEYPHDTDAFTQGLLVEKGVLWESTGLVGRSSIRKVDLTSGEVLRRIALERPYFGEGMVIWRDKIVQLTWRDKKGFVYDKNTLERTDEFSYDHEGWGITHNGKELIVTSGEAYLYFWNPETLVETKRVPVTQNGRPVNLLNEIEWIDGLVYANVWHEDRIVIIEPKNGLVVGQLDLSALKQPGGAKIHRNVVLTLCTDVLNGIAYDEATDRVLVTGKLWPKLFALKITKT